MRVLLKIGGSLDGEGSESFVHVISKLTEQGDDVILVHGGGPEISRQLSQAGLTLPFEEGVRITTSEAIPVVVQALQTCNDQIQKRLAAYGFRVASVVDGSAVVAKDAGRARTGEVASVNTARLESMLEQGVIPLIAPYAIDEQEVMYNLNADTVAAHIAGAIGADKLVFCTDVAGVFADYEAGERLYQVSSQELETFLAEGAFKDGMAAKVRAMLDAAKAGVPETWVVDGRDAASLSFAIESGSVNDAHRHEFGTCLVNSAHTLEVQ